MRIIILILALLLTMAPVYGQSPDQESGSEQSALPDQSTPPAEGVENQETQEAKPEKDAMVGTETPDIFIPSEDISEDISVAFPVDI